ncbi:murein transglycosylase A [Noviherbaspirillum agri]
MRFSLLVLAVAGAFTLSSCTTLPPEKSADKPVQIKPAAPAQTPAQPAESFNDRFRPASFASLPGWDKDNLREAWPAFLMSCEALARKADWKELCMAAGSVESGNEKAIRGFFETHFQPYQLINPDGTETGLVTGYYEPLLRGARKRGGPYQIPLHRAPDDLLSIDLSSVYPELKNMRLRGRLVGNKVVPYPSRADMAASNTLAGKELVWVDDPIEAFFLQIQGSGRVQLADSKEIVRVAYADQNGHPYKSIGRYLVDKGEMTLDQASAQSIKAWFAANPARQQELLNANPSYVFFREEKLVDANKGPKGTLGVPLTPQRSIAVDAQFVPLGLPVFLSTTRPNSDAPLQRLVMAQDTGGAIKNVVRADFFWGFGADAGEKAGKMKQRGAMWVLLPKASAGRLLSASWSRP